MVELSPRFRAPSRLRRSTVINRKPASNIWHAFNLAADLGLPLTTFVTINFGLTSCAPGNETAQFCLLLNRHFAPWWRRYGPSGPYAFVWVFEAGGGCVSAHLALHMPDRHLNEFARRVPKWVATVTGGLR